MVHYDQNLCWSKTGRCFTAPDKMLFYSVKVLIFFLFLCKNRLWAHILSALGTFNEYPQHIFMEK